DYGIKYVLLAGNGKHIPPRYVYSNTLVSVYPIISDLYYADIFDAEKNFSSWDSNMNNKFGEIKYDFFKAEDKLIDSVDLYPDVYLGRLLCNNSSELDIVVNKIINYEDNTFGTSWFKNIMLCGGDEHALWKEILMSLLESPRSSVWEGEFIGNKIAETMSDFNTIKLYASENLPILNKSNDDAEPLTLENIRDTINNGVGFVLITAHGSPTIWGTYTPIIKSNAPSRHGYSISDIEDLKNNDMLPIIVLNACSCGDFSENRGVDSPIIWEFVKKKDGGAIGGIAGTSLVSLEPGSVCMSNFNGYLIDHAFTAYSEGKEKLGDMFSQAIIDYINNHDMSEKIDDTDYKSLHIWTLFGDPSLQIGGYS
ncbi:MAG: C25 family cysteine peptidase, partial [Candidatus Thermoplasmatota archaeon]|nr:C25 family cysteine peptidase [Candidatus Thermoplasmatota archaeon]